MAISHLDTWSRMAIQHCYWYLVVKNGKFTLLLTSTGQEWQFHIALISSGEEWQLHTATDIYMVKNDNCTLLMTPSCYWHCYDTYSQEWQFHTAIDTYRSRMAHFDIIEYWCSSLLKNGNFTLLLVVKNGNYASSGQVMAISHCLLTPTGLEWKFHTAIDTYRQFHIATDI